MKTRASVLAAALLMTTGAQAAPEQAVVRSYGMLPPRDVVLFVGANAVPLQYDDSQRPTWATMTAGAIASEICGTVETGYIDSLNSLNQRNDILATSVLGRGVFGLKWPECLNVMLNPKYTTIKGDSFYSIQLSMTGRYRGAANAKTFFANSGLTYAQHLNIPQHTTLTLPYKTSETLLQVGHGSATDFVNGLKKVGGSNVYVNENLGPGGCIIDRVGTECGSAGSTQFSQVICAPGDDSYPFDANFLAWTYNRAVSAGGQYDVLIMVVDNGFVGVPCSDTSCPEFLDGGGIRFSDDRFPQVLFPPDNAYTEVKNEYVGPFIASTGAHPIIYQDYQNDFHSDDVDDVSGHGTAVASLVVGGPIFQSYRALTFQPRPNKSYLNIINLALSKGTEQMVPDSARQFKSYLDSVEPPDIVNLSIEFDGYNDVNAVNQFRDSFNAYKNSLFIAAAGNENADLGNERYYPAALGGPGMPNLMTVAWLDGDGKLSSQSNRGGGHVDIAAPGCRIPAWLDGDDDPVPFSGTSAAAPIVTFAAALLKASWNAAPPQVLKNRLEYSGDLIADPQSRAGVTSSVSLNIAKALFWADDYVRIKDRVTHVETAYLGTLASLPGLNCDNGKQYAWEQFRALKRLELHDPVIIYQAPGPVTPLRLCDGHLAETTGNPPVPAEIGFTAKVQISDKAPYFVDIANVKALPADEVLEIVRGR